MKYYGKKTMHPLIVQQALSSYSVTLTNAKIMLFMSSIVNK